MADKLFALGMIVITDHALARLGFIPGELLRAHERGAYGAATEAELEQNQTALLEGGRIMSRYIYAGEIVWVVTENLQPGGLADDTTLTTVMLPEDM